MGWKCKAHIVGGDSGFNSLVFASSDQALGYGKDLMSRWTLMCAAEPIEFPDLEPTHEWDNERGLRSLPDGEFSYPARSVDLGGVAGDGRSKIQEEGRQEEGGE